MPVLSGSVAINHTTLATVTAFTFHFAPQHSNCASSCLNCYLLRVQHEAEEPSAETGGVPNGPKRETEARKSRISRENSNPLLRLGKGTFRVKFKSFPTPRIFATIQSFRA
jgi:hypothetical protein